MSNILSKKQSGFALPIAILIAVVLIVAGGVGYYFYKTSQEEKEIKIPEVKVPEEVIKDETADWKTYRSEEYGFELKYPKEWREPVETKRPYPAEGVLYSYLVGFYRSTGPGGFEVTIYEKPSDLDYAGLDEGVGLPQKGKEIPEVCPKPTRELSIGVENYPAKIVYVSPEDRCFQETYFYILQKGNYNYVLIPVPNGGSGIGYVGYDGKVETEKHLPEFNQILSTFKFVEK